MKKFNYEDSHTFFGYYDICSFDAVNLHTGQKNLLFSIAEIAQFDRLNR